MSTDFQFPTEFWARLYEQGRLTPDQRKVFEEALAENEEAINALSTYFSVINIQKRGMVRVAFQPANELHIQPIELPGELSELVKGDDKEKVTSWLTSFADSIAQAFSKNYKTVLVPVATVATVAAFVIFVPKTGDEFTPGLTRGTQNAFHMQLEAPEVNDAGSLVFAWPEQEGVGEYTVRLLNEDLEQVYVAKTEGSSFVYPADAPKLTEDTNYFWQLQFEKDGEDHSFTKVFRLSQVKEALAE